MSTCSNGRWWAWLAVIAVAAGCERPEAPPQPGPVEQTPPSFFSPDPQTLGPRVRLRQAERAQGRLVLELVTEEVDDVHGVAFRLSFDPAVLSFQQLESDSPLVGAREAHPGVLVGFVSERGETRPPVRAPPRIMFDVLAPTASSDVRFVSSASIVMKPDGEEAPVTFVGGRFGPR